MYDAIYKNTHTQEITDSYDTAKKWFNNGINIEIWINSKLITIWKK